MGSIPEAKSAAERGRSRKPGKLCTANGSSVSSLCSSMGYDTRLHANSDRQGLKTFGPILLLSEQNGHLNPLDGKYILLKLWDADAIVSSGQGVARSGQDNT